MGDWSFTTRPEFWFGTIMCGLVVNIISHVITTRFPRWLAKIGGWRGALDLFLSVYAIAGLLCGIGAAAVSKESLRSVLDHTVAPGFAVMAMVGIVVLDGKIVSKCLMAIAAISVVTITFWLITTSPEPMSMSSKLSLFLLLNFPLGLVAMFAWVASAVVWFWRHEMNALR